LTPTAKFLLFTLLATGMGVSSAQTAEGPSAEQPGALKATVDNPASPNPGDSPVAEVRKNLSWEISPFVNYGKGIGGDRSQYNFFWAGVEGGKILTPVLHAGILSGQFQYAANIMPLWLAFTPAPHEEQFICESNNQPVPCDLPVGGGTFHGVSITPVILRWNFLNHSRRFQPWFQGAGGLIYTTHKFPPNLLSNPALGIDGGTSVWNFSPQGGIGVHYFTGMGRSIDIGVNAVHISSASLGDRNPGVNASIQVQVGYTFWR
jgi:lipid A 3-O-deacylase